MLRALIVDDDEMSLNALQDHLMLFHKQRFLKIHVARNAKTARKIINNEKINVLFLDIEMPEETGFDLLNSLKEVNFFIVFTTNYAHYAIKAIKSGAIDYLMKPVKANELNLVLKKIEKLISKNKGNGETSISPEKQSNGVVKFFDFYQTQTNEKNSFIIPHQGGIKIFPFHEVLKIVGDGNYSKIWDVQGKDFLTSKTLKYFDVKLQDNDCFYRVHKSAIVNTAYIKELYKEGISNYARLNNGTSVEISRRSYPGLVEKISGKLK